MGRFGKYNPIIDTSVGVSQVRISTAKFIENNSSINIEKYSIVGTLSPKISGGCWKDNYTNIVYCGTENFAREMRLEDNRLNIFYAGAYLQILTNMWKNQFPQIINSPSILGTLYNRGHSIQPHPNPTPNGFGIFIRDNYNLLKYLLKAGDKK